MRLCKFVEMFIQNGGGHFTVVSVLCCGSVLAAFLQIAGTDSGRINFLDKR
jgi:hypothetical protein